VVRGPFGITRCLNAKTLFGSRPLYLLRGPQPGRPRPPCNNFIWIEAPYSCFEALHQLVRGPFDIRRGPMQQLHLVRGPYSCLEALRQLVRGPFGIRRGQGRSYLFRGGGFRFRQEVGGLVPGPSPGPPNLPPNFSTPRI